MQVAVVGLLLSLILDCCFFLPCVIRSVLLLLTFGIGIFFASRYRFDPVASLDPPKTDLKTDKILPSKNRFNGKLFAAVYDYPESLGYSKELINEIRKDVWNTLSSMSLWQTAKQYLKPGFLVISIIALELCISILPAPKSLWLKRFFMPQNKYLIFTVTPGDAKIPYGNFMEITVKPKGVLPNRIMLVTSDNYVYNLYRNDGYKANIKVTNSFSYLVRLRDVSSDKYNVSVVIQPWIKEFKLTYSYPDYTGLPRFVSNMPEISALPGTRIMLTAVANEKLGQGKIQFGNQKTLEAEIKSETLKAEFNVSLPDSYQIYLVAESGLQTAVPEKYSINIWKDKFPEVKIIYPGIDMEMPPGMKTPLAIHISDDFGFSKVKLMSDKGEWDITPQNTLPADTVIPYFWDLSEIDLLPGEAVTYWVEARDNDKINGYKPGKSERFKLYFPTVEDIYKEVEKEINKTQSTAASELEKALQNLNYADKQLESILGDSVSGKLNWYDKQSIKKIMQKEKLIAEEMQRLSEDIDNLYKYAENSMVIDNELMMKMEELKSLFSDLDMKELNEAIKKVEEALTKNPELLAEAMKNFNITQEELRQRVENTIEILKKYKQEQTLAALADKANDLKEWQERINEKTSQKNNNKQALSAEEKKLAEELDKLSKEIEKLARELDNEELNKEAGRANKTRSKASKAASELARGFPSLQLQKEVSNDLSDLSIGLGSIYNLMLDQRKSEFAREINKLMNDFILLSFEEENINTIDGHIEAAFTQEALLKGTKSAANDLSSAMKDNPFLKGNTDKQAKDALKNMENAKRSFESGETVEARNAQNRAMTKLNEVVLSLINAEQALESSRSSSGMPELLQQLAQLTKDQQALNQMCMSFMSFSMSQSGMKEQLAQLMEKQAALSKALSDLAGGLKGKTLGDMGSMAQEMEKIAKDMQAGITKDIVERQNKLLNHLLDAQKSIYTRKYSRQRIAEPGENKQLSSPPEPRIVTKRGVSQKAIIEALQKEYPKEYEQLIKAYFQSLSTE